MGLVADVFSEKTLKKLSGRNAIGHVRYSTAGGSQLSNAQPFCAITDGGPVAIAHNGNLVNALAIRRELEGRGAIFSTTVDSEVIVQLMARSRERTAPERQGSVNTPLLFFGRSGHPGILSLKQSAGGPGVIKVLRGS